MAMGLYFFHIRRGDQFIQDFEGEEFANLEAARAEAITAARDILASDVKCVDAPKLRIEVTTETGQTVLAVNAQAQISLSVAQA